jgi:hypothetical protein
VTHASTVAESRYGVLRGVLRAASRHIKFANHVASSKRRIVATDLRRLTGSDR